MIRICIKEWAHGCLFGVMFSPLNGIMDSVLKERRLIQSLTSGSMNIVLTCEF